MPNYFDYMLESAEIDIESPEDLGLFYNEMDATIAQFDTYVQEGVGVKILIGIGIAAALGGLIALIIKLFSGKSGGNSASTKSKNAKTATQKAKKAGVKKVEIKVATGDEAAPKAQTVTSPSQSTEKAEKHVEEIVETVSQYNDFVEKYFNIVAREIEKLINKYPNPENLSEKEEKKLKREISDIAMQIFDEVLDDFPIIKKLLGAKTKSDAKKTITKLAMGNESTAKKVTKNVLNYVTSELDIDEIASFVDSTMKQCKTLLFDGKKLSKNGERLKKVISEGTNNSNILDGFSCETFDQLTAMISNELNEAYQFISQNMDEIVKACKEAINQLDNGASLEEALDDGKFVNTAAGVVDRIPGTFDMLSKLRR